MKTLRIFVLLAILVSLVVTACESEPEVVEKEVTKVVKETVIETVVEKETVIETVIEKETVLQTVVEKETVLQTVVEEVVVTATAEAVAEGPRVGGTLVWAWLNEPDTLDAQKTAFRYSMFVLEHIGSPLVTISPDGDYVGWLAESWEMSEDGLTWDFKLREGVKFHDGTPCTAHDWVWTIERAKDPETNSPSSGPMLDPVASAEALDDYTLRLNLTEPYFPLLYSLTRTGNLQPLSRAAVEQWGDDYGRHPVGVGPYKFKEWITGDTIIVERNPDYNWAPPYAHQGPWYFEEIHFRTIPEYSTLIAGMEAGEVHFYWDPQPPEWEGLEASGNIQLFKGFTTGIRPYLQFNVSKPPFDDVRVRKAFNMAVDRQELVKIVTLGNGREQKGPISLSTIGYWPGVEEIGYGYDLEQAKALMQEAGYTYNEEGMLEKDGEPLILTLDVVAIQMYEKTAEILQQQFKDLGVEFEFETNEAAIFLARLRDGDYAIATNGSARPEFDMMYGRLRSGQGSNDTRVNDPKLDEILDKTRTSVDPEERQHWVNEAQKYIIEQAYLVPLFTPMASFAVSTHIKGIKFNEKNLIVYLDDAWFAED